MHFLIVDLCNAIPLLWVVGSAFHSAVAARGVRAVVPAGPALKSRQLGLKPAYTENHLFYVDEYEFYESHIPEKVPFGARISFDAPNYPVLHLDHAVEHFSHVFCFTSCLPSSSSPAMHMHFTTQEQAVAAQEAWDASYPFVMITSHPACAGEDGIHQPYMIHKAHFSPEELKATLFAEALPMNEVADKMHLTFGRKVDLPDYGTDRSIRKKRSLIRDAPFSNGCSTAPFSETIPEIPEGYYKQISRPQHFDKRAPIPQMSSYQPSDYPTRTDASATASATATTVVQDLTSSITDVAILPPVPGLKITVKGVPSPVGLTLKCKECNTAGSAELEEGQLSMRSGGDAYEKFEDFLETGFVKLSVQGMKAKMLFDVNLTPQFAAQAFTAHLPTINILGLDIPGVGSIGPVLDPQIIMNMKLNDGFEFTTGFDLAVPDAEIYLNISSIGDSTSSGFDQSVLSPYPIGAKENPPSFTFSVAFQPAFLLSFVVDNHPVTGGAGIFVDVPRFNVSVTEVNNVLDTCEPAQGGSSSGSQVFGTAFQIAKSLVYAVGAQANLNFESLSISDSRVLASKVVNLQTDCMAFDPKSQDLQNTTTIEGKSSSSSSAAASSHQIFGRNCLSPSVLLGCFTVAWAYVWWVEGVLF